MFIKQVLGRILITNDKNEIVFEYKDAKIKKTDNRILVLDSKDKCICDMPMENTTILY